jgi:signal peptidase I
MTKSIKKELRKYLTWDNLIFITVVAFIFSYLFFQVIILQTTSPQVAVTTTSMVPTYNGFDLKDQGDIPRQYFDILRGDLLIVQNIAPKVGDVIVFNVRNQDVPIVHRIIAEKTLDNGTIVFATKGDHNDCSDLNHCGNPFGWINRENILGVVVYSIHFVGWFSLLLQNPLIRTFLIVATLAIIVIAIYDSFYGEESKEKSKLQTDGKKIKKYFLRFKSKRIRLSRPNLFVFITISLLLTTYIGIGYNDYSRGSNSVIWISTNDDEEKNIINLISGTSKNIHLEKDSDLFIYNTALEITSSGTFNSVCRLEVTAVYNNLSLTNPTYVWTVVYDFYGSKLIHNSFLFNAPPNTGLAIDTTIYFKIFSFGLLADPVQTTSINVTVLI